MVTGTRELIRSEEEQKDGKTLYRLELGDYQWLTFRDVMERVMFFGKGKSAE